MWEANRRVWKQTCRSSFTPSENVEINSGARSCWQFSCAQVDMTDVRSDKYKGKLTTSEGGALVSSVGPIRLPTAPHSLTAFVTGQVNSIRLVKWECFPQVLVAHPHRHLSAWSPSCDVSKHQPRYIWLLAPENVLLITELVLPNVSICFKH